MSKLFDFIEKHKLQVAIEFLLLSVITLFLPTFAFITTSKTDGTSWCQYINFNFYSFTEIGFLSFVFITTQIILFIGLVLLIGLKLSKKRLRIDIYLLPVACICQLLMFITVLYSYINTCIYFAKFETAAIYQHIPHISFYIFTVLTIFSIIYLIAFFIKKPRPSPVNKRLSKQQQIDELKQQVKDLQDQIDKHD